MWRNASGGSCWHCHWAVSLRRAATCTTRLAAATRIAARWRPCGVCSISQARATSCPLPRWSGAIHRAVLAIQGPSTAAMWDMRRFWPAF